MISHRTLLFFLLSFFNAIATEPGHLPYGGHESPASLALKNFKPDVHGFLGSVPLKAIVVVGSSTGKNFGNITFTQDYFTPDAPIRVEVNVKERFRTEKKTGNYWNIFTTNSITLRGDLTSILGRAVSLVSNTDHHCDNVGLAEEEVWSSRGEE